MIGSVTGQVAYVSSDYCLVETSGGVGYRIFMPATQLTSLTVGQEVKVLTSTIVREDAILLYGFLTREYYNLFTLLLTVNGIGPKGARGILSAVKPDAFYLAIQSRDVKALTKLPGIGKKTAERMVLELKDKVGGLTGSETEGTDVAAAFGAAEGSPVNEALEVLTSLGYTNSEILPALQKIPGYEKLSAEDLTRQVLKIFGGRK
ncbi:MAG: Holliday junction branch migration protein RuvA [Acidaminococcaceae bacterium]|jgi:holliday junction DNA helicase RuvA|nr:Holliday junction branch migration protein RuvA [Acidaminococcaceae bacterium]